MPVELTDCAFGYRAGRPVVRVDGTVRVAPSDCLGVYGPNGAAAALGDWFLFVDADTLVSAATLAEMFSLIDTGKFMGGAAILRYDRTPPFWKSFLFVSNRIVIPLMGWTAGAGLEALITPNVTARVEYRHTEYEDKTFTLGAPTAVDLGTDSIRAGVGVRF